MYVVKLYRGTQGVLNTMAVFYLEFLEQFDQIRKRAFVIQLATVKYKIHGNIGRTKAGPFGEQ